MVTRSGVIQILFFLLWITPCVGQTKAEVNLAGYNHVPMVRTPAMGHAEVTVSGDSLFVEGEFENLRGRYWSAHIHFGEIGKRGHRLLRLKAELDETGSGGTFHPAENAFRLTEPVRAALREGKLYINIASTRFQHGEIRGQIPPM